MSRRASRVWFGKPSTTTTTNTTSSTFSTRTPKSQPPAAAAEQVQLAVVLENIATYRPYKPGTGPRPRPITLIPVRDTTAYVREEFFVPPTLSRDGKKRLQYVVGWTDLPAARLVVDAERIADYVSPLAYEEWCAARAAERDEEKRRKEEVENVRAVAQAEARERGVCLRNDAVKETSAAAIRKTVGWKGGKRKRRNKAQMEAARAAAGTAASAADTALKDEDSKNTPKRSRKDARSLSTPSKARLQDFLELEPEPEIAASDDDDDEEAIRRQLNQEGLLSGAADQYDSDEASSVSLGLEPPPAKKQRAKSPGAPPSRLLSGFETDSNRTTPFASSRGATSSPVLLSPLKPNNSSSATSQPTQSLLPPPTFPSVPQASANHTSTSTATEKKANPILPPMLPHKRCWLSVRDPQSSSPRSQPSSSKTLQTPPTKQWKPRPKMKETAIKASVNGRAMKSYPRTESAAPAAIPIQTNLTPTTTAITTTTTAAATSRPHSGFTPLGKSSTTFWNGIKAGKNASVLTPSQPVQSIERPSSSSFSKPNPKSSSTPKRNTDPPQPRTSIFAKNADEDRDELAQDVYEVLRLEGLQVRHVRGKPVRYFAVRWKGDWPPGQNPTWEPEGNIPRYLVRKYLLANPTPRKGRTGTLDKYLTTTWSQRKYSSVSEAFEGGDPEAAAAKAEGEEAVVEEDEEVKEAHDGGEDEMLVVTDEPASTEKPTLSW